MPRKQDPLLQLMRDGTIYDIDFVTTGPQVTSIKIHRINGESLR